MVEGGHRATPPSSTARLHRRETPPPLVERREVSARSPGHSRDLDLEQCVAAGLESRRDAPEEGCAHCDDPPTGVAECSRGSLREARVPAAVDSPRGSEAVAPRLATTPWASGLQ